MAYTNVIQPGRLISIDTSAFTGAYILLTPASGLLEQAGLLIFNNNSNTGVTISYDGVNDQDFVVPGGTNPIYAQQLALPQGQACYFPKGQRIWVKGTAGTGLFYVSTYGNKLSLV